MFSEEPPGAAGSHERFAVSLRGKKRGCAIATGAG